MPPRFLIFFGLCALQAISLTATAGELVRIRLIKNLTEFPQIQNAQVQKINDRLWILKGSKLIFQNKKLSGQNLIVKNSKQKFDVVGQFDFDRYLAGVVASEMPTKWPMEALNTQAIVARSFALARINERQNQIFHLDSDQMDQVFQAHEDPRAMQAVKNTTNIILQNQKGEVLKAFFHADCGGQTVPASKVWPGETDTGTAVDPWCQNRKSNRWSYEISEKEFLKGLQKNQNSEISEGELFQQKIQTVEVDHFQFTIQKLRQIFGFSKIKNSPESVEVSDGKITLSGKGFGHGAGLCQWGTLEQAKRGYTSIQILKHYYPKAEIALNSSVLALQKSILPKLVSR
jgi:stage II sporulation protein D